MKGLARFIALSMAACVSVLLVPRIVEAQSAANAFRPAAITGIASSARHCVSGDASNVHGIGWVEAGSVYTITFEADFSPVVAVARLDLDGRAAAISYGNPDVRLTASGPGTLALYVGAVRQAGCYRYKVEIEPPARSVASGGRASEPRAPASGVLVKPPKSPIRTTAITGLPSSAKHCAAGHWVSKVHGIGRVEQGSRITITFESDFDPIAGTTIADPETRQGRFLVDDDSGGSLEPRLNFTASSAGTLALYVAGYNGGAGCYHFKVDIQAPSSTPTPRPTVRDVAPTLGRTLGSVVLTALHRGATRSAALDSRPSTWLARLLAWFSPTVHAQSTRWTASCPGGGGARIELPDSLPFIGQVSLVNTTTVWTSCAMTVGGATVVANGRTSLNGTWSSTAASSPIGMQGSLDVSDIGSLAVNIQVNGATGAFNGQIGNIPVGGVIDGPFIPRPSPPAPSPTPTPTPTPPGVTQFDGTYSGSYTGTFGSFGPQNGPVAFSVSNGVITVTQPGSGSGTVNAAGSASFSGSLGVQGVSCTFTGTFLAAGGAASASGNWNCSGLGQTGSGTWSATRS